METEQKLKPCPLCNGEAAFDQNKVDFEPVWAVRCGGCDLYLDVRADSKEEAAAMWNNRPPPTNGLAEENARLEHFLDLRTRQLARSKEYWVRAAEKALAGDPDELRNRVALANTKDFKIVQSDAAHTPGKES